MLDAWNFTISTLPGEHSNLISTFRISRFLALWSHFLSGGELTFSQNRNQNFWAAASHVRDPGIRDIWHHYALRLCEGNMWTSYQRQDLAGCPEATVSHDRSMSINWRFWFSLVLVHSLPHHFNTRHQYFLDTLLYSHATSAIHRQKILLPNNLFSSTALQRSCTRHPPQEFGH